MVGRGATNSPVSPTLKKEDKDMKNYYNTTNASEDQLDVFVQAATNQDDKVYEVFRAKKIPMTPIMVLDEVYKHEPDQKKMMLITSIRRSINTLTKAGRLMKLNMTKVERMGRPNYLWVLKVA